MANITPVQLSFTPPGVTKPTLVAATAGGDTVLLNNGTTMTIIIANGHATLARTVTLDDQGSVSPPNAQAFDPDVDFVIPALTEKWITGISVARFTASVLLTYSDSGADLTIGAFII